MMAKALFVTGAVLVVLSGIATAQTAFPEAPTNVAEVRWGATLAELQKVRANAKCHIEYEKRSPSLGGEEHTEKTDLERGLLIIPVRFKATCFEVFEDGDVTFRLDGNPPRFHEALIDYQAKDYTVLRERFIALYGQPSERHAQARPRWRLWWSAAPSHDPERLTWRRPHATVILYSAEYEQLGRKMAKPIMVIKAVNPPTR